VSAGTNCYKYRRLSYSSRGRKVKKWRLIMIQRHKTGGPEERYKEMRKTEKRSRRNKRRHYLKNKFMVLLTIMLYVELDIVMNFILDIVMNFIRSVMNWTYSKW
jgi:uncharacterized oligopeptide transporter (OPT) family protein